MHHLENIFDNIGRGITSLAAVIFVMLMTISGMIFFSHTLFNQVFPTSMTHWEKLFATWLMALGWEFTVLITTCNARHINKNIPGIMAVSSGVIVLFFIQAFDDTQTILTIAQRWFVGVLAATINYIYAELFYAKWKERHEQRDIHQQLVEQNHTINQLQSELNESKRTLDEWQRDMNEVSTELEQLKRYKIKHQRELTCPHCGVVQESHGTLQAHKGYCDKNPNRRTKKVDPAVFDVIAKPSTFKM